MDNLFNFPNTLAPAPEVAPPTPAPELAPAPRSTTKEWLTNLKEVEAYIDKNKKRPLNSDKDKNVRKYANWINRQQRRYQNKDKSILPSNIKKLWENFINDDKYKEYFICRKEEWILQLELVVEYIVENKKRPSQTDKDKEIKKLSMWITEQKYNYKNRQGYVYDEINRHLWEDFINEYEDYL